MIRETHTACCPEQYLTAIGLDPERVIYFDIETTGLRASTSQLYMIGWAVKECSCACPADAEDTWTVTQIMAETYAEESLLLKEFTDVLRQYDTIIEFNGDRFDLPYVREKCASCSMEDPFENIRTVDLYQEIRPCRTLLGLTRMNQKSVEQFLRITREDPYNGGQLIDVYRSVRNHSSTDIDVSIRCLFLHNYEDVLGMMEMTPILAYPMILRSTSPVSCRLLSADGTPVCDIPFPEDGAAALPVEQFLSTSDEKGPCCLEASFSVDVPVPRDLEIDMGFYRIDVCSDTVFLTIPLIRRTMYHFFPNYRDYYYLPEEDTAMHKSVACFVDPDHREKATAQNCYVKKEGIFLPQAEEMFQPSFLLSRKDTISWFELSGTLPGDRDAFSSYVHTLLSFSLFN